MVLKPILESFDISFKSDTPFIKEPRISGTAINFKALIDMFPNGFTQFVIKVLPQLKLFKIKAKTIPRTIPITICQCSANFFIYQKNLFILQRTKIKEFHVIG